MRPLFFLVALATTALTIAACQKKAVGSPATAGSATADAASTAPTPDAASAPPPPGADAAATAGPTTSPAGPTTTPQGGTTTAQGGPPPVNTPPQ